MDEIINIIINEMIFKSKKILILIFLLILTFKIQAQFDAQFSQYYEVPNYYNPASLGFREKLNFTVLDRLQWVGIPNAPKTFFVTGEMPITMLKKPSGVGIVFYNETLGLFKNMMAAAQYAYKLKLYRGQLALGLQVGVIDQKFDGSKISIPTTPDHNTNDNALPTNEVQSMVFDMNFGAFYLDPKFYAGISVSHLTAPDFKLTEDKSINIGRLYYLTTGGNILMKKSLYELQPSLLLKTDMQMMQLDLTARVLYNKMFSGGVSYRWKDAVVLLIGAQFGNVRFGYSYDVITSAIARASSGSHEIFLNYSVKLDFAGKNKSKHKSIRIL